MSGLIDLFIDWVIDLLIGWLVVLCWGMGEEPPTAYEHGFNMGVLRCVHTIVRHRGIWPKMHLNDLWPTLENATIDVWHSHDASQLCTINGIFCVNFRLVQKILLHITILANRGSNCTSYRRCLADYTIVGRIVYMCTLHYIVDSTLMGW